MSEWHDIREDEVPTRIWEFQLWLKRYWEEQGAPAAWTWVQFNEVKAEAKQRGITIQPNGLIDYRGDA